jgi:hypothetical protein
VPAAPTSTCDSPVRKAYCITAVSSQSDKFDILQGCSLKAFSINIRLLMLLDDGSRMAADRIALAEAFM